MRIAVVSDTHGVLTPLQQAVAQTGPVDYLFHAGDFKADLAEAARLFGLSRDRCWGVAGNCDYPEKEPAEKVLELDGVRILLTHGHRQEVKRTLQRLFYRALELKARVVVFGHSHIPVNTEQSGVLLFNPGSPSFPRLPGPGTCGVLEITEDQVAGRHLALTASSF